MKKILVPILLAVLMLCYSVPKVKASDYTASVSTYAVTSAAETAAEISGIAKVEKFVFLNSTTTATTVTVYKNCGSTTTIEGVLSVALPSVAVGPGTLELDYSSVIVNNPFKYTDICFRKEDDAANGYVKVSVHYR